MTDGVGYRNPPKHSRWTKGQSGNPSGRKKGKRDLRTDLDAELNETVPITENGRQRRITKQQAFLKRILAKALDGDPRFSKLLADMAMRLPETEDAADADPLSPEERKLFDQLFPTAQSGGGDGDQ
ncbi:MAG: DUF5681 domain-containing protein [Sphingomonadaceae bacterium]